ncbi:unnamed protein product [Aureobasidium mustum]|uniref:Uncharacterized protein n=1 Tax=Aureobasidium mustum TaxID=2773714 RepID=A0A9N8PJA2_9PEZI|nr:unnamed protein product [Aureobasidium mustum]
MAASIDNSSELVSNWHTGIVNGSDFQPALSQSLLPAVLAGWSMWQYILTFLLGVIVYDQGKQHCLSVLERST